jgi:hypothetical protein
VVAKYLMIPAAAFNVSLDGTDYYNIGYKLGLSSGSGLFVTPVYLPPGARIRMIKFYAYDANPNSSLCAYLYETHPKTGTQSFIGQLVCTKGSSGYQQPIKYFSHYVKWYYGYYIKLEYKTSANLDACAVMIKYTINQ